METIGTIVDQTLDARIIQCSTRVLDVVRREAEPLQPGQIVDELPSNTGQGKLAEQPQHNDNITSSHDLLDSGILQQLAQDLVGSKILSGDLAGGVCVARIVRVDLIDCGQHLLHSGKGKEPSTGGDELAEAGLLGHYRLSCGQIAHAAIAEPAAPWAYIDVLGHSKFSA